MSKKAIFCRQVKYFMSHLPIWGALGIFLMGMISACSPRHLMVNEMTSLMEGGLKIFEQDSDLAMLKQALPAHIKLAEAMLVQSPRNARLKIVLAQLYGAYAFAFEETEFERLYFDDGGNASADYRTMTAKQIKESLSLHFIKGAEYAKSALCLKYPDAEKALVNISERDQFLAELTRDDVPALFWYGFNIAGYVSRNMDSVKAMALASPAEAAMKRVIELSTDYYHGTAHMVLMVFHGARPAMLGGSLETAKAHYRTLKSIAGDNFFLADVLYARYCLPREQDRELFEKMLARIQSIPPDASDSYALFNQVAAQRAKIYLKAADRMFE